jgi:hypothetical protein
MENLKKNDPWGDTLTLEKQENTFRIYGINPNAYDWISREAT